MNPHPPLLKKIPSVTLLLEQPEFEMCLADTSRKHLLNVIREVLVEKRKAILSGFEPELDLPTIWKEIGMKLTAKATDHLCRVVNGTGVIVHTNLGRSLLAAQALEQVQTTGKYYSNLEFDLELGQRGSRYSHVEDLLIELTGAEAALVVNNNAAAVLLALDTLAKGKEVVVSRGQLVEIGGSFRIPEVMARSGAVLREVGTTNKTHLRDYEAVLTDQTALLLKVHTSNYRIVGFTTEVPLEDLVALGQRHNVAVMEDLGSGSFIDVSRFGLEKEPTVIDVVKAGADVVTFSGDKLLGGPQAGIIVGRKIYIQALRGNPLNRALRIDKLTLAALEATLKLYRNQEQALRDIPTLAQLTIPLSKLHERAKSLYRLLNKNPAAGITVEIVPTTSQVGGGALPLSFLNSYALALASDKDSSSEIERRFRAFSPPIIGRIEKEHFLLDVRTLQKEDFPFIAQCLKTWAD
ncbi:MAG: L-seryl-tRNA(Sec) selenium transferase [Deltaproteobacteria bacterium RBG_13_43_22]|nr:MAG: L-seryl-tRNA(Sec) selenium transferase [Deltaproteobacteria bacterium RBG_13_43_22]